MIDNREINEILEILETLEDEQLAVMLLKSFNQLTSEHGKLILNKDNSLSHEEWKKRCDALENEIDLLVEKIRNLA